MAPISQAPLDPEAERPRNFTEAISSDQTWETFGIRIKWTEPLVPGDFRMPMNEPVKLRLCVETKNDLEVPPEALSAWCWTPIKTKQNPCGIWKEIKLCYNPKCTQWNDHGVTSYVFQSVVVPTQDEHYRLTFNVKHNKTMIWANHFQVDNILSVEQKPSIATQTIIHPSVHFSCNFSDKKQSPGDSCGGGVKSPSRSPRGNETCDPASGTNEEDLEMLVML